MLPIDFLEICLLNPVQFLCINLHSLRDWLSTIGERAATSESEQNTPFAADRQISQKFMPLAYFFFLTLTFRQAKSVTDRARVQLNESEQKTLSQLFKDVEQLPRAIRAKTGSISFNQLTFS